MIRLIVFLCTLLPTVLALQITAIAEPTPTPTQTEPAPIEIRSCRLMMNRVGAGVGLDFVNHRGAPADMVHFIFVYGGKSRGLLDRGRFSPKVLISHLFSVIYDRYMGHDSPERCYADFVHFSDGTTWTAPR